MSYRVNSYQGFGGAAACDMYWPYVQMLLPCDTSGVPADSAGRTTLTLNGTAPTLDTSVKKFGAGSRYFAGNGSYREGDKAAYATATADITFEMWVRVSSSTTGVDQTLAQTRDGVGNGWLLRYVHASGKLDVISDTGITGLITTSAISTDTWYHVAFTKQGSSLRLFLNGVLQATVTSSQSFTADWFALGSRWAVDVSQWYYFKGHMDEVRFTIGIARYTANFTPPTAAFDSTACAYTGWTPADGTAPYAWYIADDPANTQSGGTLTTLVDKSGNGRNISTSIDYATNGIHSRDSIATGFSGKRMALPAGTASMLNGAAGWTAAFSLYRIDGGAYSQVLFFAENNALNTSRAALQIEGTVDDTPRIVSRRADGDSAALLVSSTTVENEGYALMVGGVDLANRIARIRTNGTETTGTAFGTSGSTFSATNSYSTPYLLDSNASGSGGSEEFIGNVGDIVLYNVPVMQTEMQKLEGYLAWKWEMLDLLPSTHPYKLVQPEAVATTISMLFHFNGADASTSIVDSSSNALTATAFGNAQLDTAQAKWGASSALFDGTGDYITVAHNAFMNTGANDFTVHFWIRTTTVAAGQAIMVTKRADNSVFSPFMVRRSGNTLEFLASESGSGWQINATGGTLVANTWHHIAVVRNGASMKVYLDGSSAASGTLTSAGASLMSNSSALVLGGDTNTSYFNGHMDEAVWEAGAKWTANFTAPTEPYL